MIDVGFVTGLSLFYPDMTPTMAMFLTTETPVIAFLTSQGGDNYNTPTYQLLGKTKLLIKIIEGVRWREMFFCDQTT